MIGDKAREAIIECTPRAVFAKRPYVKTSELPIVKGEYCSPGTDMYITSGIYTLKFKSGVPGYENQPFVIKCDMFVGNRIRISGLKHLAAYGEEDERAKWLVRNTNIDQHLFEVAEQHPDMPIPFCIDFNKLETNLKAKGETRKNYLWVVTEDDA